MQKWVSDGCALALTPAAAEEQAEQEKKKKTAAVSVWCVPFCLHCSVPSVYSINYHGTDAKKMQCNSQQQGGCSYVISARGRRTQYGDSDIYKVYIYTHKDRQAQAGRQQAGRQADRH